MMHYKGTYRLRPEIDKETNDFPRDINGCIAETYDDIFVDCRYGRIYYYGHADNSYNILLWAYVPSIYKGRKIKRQLDDNQIQYFDYRETDEEITFKFKAKDIHYIAELMKAKTAGANISPLSSKNLPKSTIEIPSEENAKYREIVSLVNEVDTLIIYHFTNDFCSKILTKTLRKNDKSYDFKKDIRQKKMSMNVKTYIWSMGFWDEYLAYLRKKIQTYYKSKEKE
jgi:hypothetical protein